MALTRCGLWQTVRAHRDECNRSTGPSMAAKRRISATTQNNTRLGMNALQAGDFQMAATAFGEAVKADKRHPGLRYNLAVALEGSGDIDAAAQHLTEALRLKPQMEEAARRLDGLLRTYEIDEPQTLNAFGLKAALAFKSLNHQPLADMAFDHLAASPPLIEMLALAEASEAAERLLLKRTHDGLKSDLLLAALQAGTNSNVGMERLLTALRRLLLLQLTEERFRDRAAFAFLLALATQCLNNEHVWAETAEEREALDALTVDHDALVSGDPDAARRLTLRLLYEPVSAGPAAALAAADCTRIRPKGLGELLEARLRDREEERALAADIPQLGTIDDETSLKVAGQYEASPYPRWTSMHVPQSGSLRRALVRYFSEDRLEVMDKPFKVLIAGSGTGSQAVLAAHAYGEKADVLGIDLSRASLAYGQRMAKKFDAKNLKFMQADILDLPDLDQTFDVIECVGVLHHMADPIAGWRVLVDRLKPGGLMLIALYSATSRSNIRALRQDPAYPGAGCSNADARAFRQTLMSRPAGEPGTELLTSGDFYTLSEFRDLALHESEQQFTLEQIKEFLDGNGLTFCGFTLPPQVFEHVQVHHKSEVWPGSLERWASVEADHPNMFDGMYQFWCEKVA